MLMIRGLSLYAFGMSYEAIQEHLGEMYGLEVSVAAEVFPLTEIQLCVIHQIRNSLKYVTSKDQNPLWPI